MGPSERERDALGDNLVLGRRAAAVEELLHDVAPERVEAELEEVAGERVLERLCERRVARLEAARDEEVACRRGESISADRSRTPRRALTSLGARAKESTARRTKLAEAQLEDVPPDGVEQLLALLLRRAPDALLQEERALLVAVREDAVDEALRAQKVGKPVSGGRDGR